MKRDMKLYYLDLVGNCIAYMCRDEMIMSRCAKQPNPREVIDNLLEKIDDEVALLEKVAKTVVPSDLNKRKIELKKYLSDYVVRLYSK